MIRFSALAGQMQNRICSISMLESYHVRKEAQTGNRAMHCGEGREGNILIVMKWGLSISECFPHLYVGDFSQLRLRPQDGVHI